MNVELVNTGSELMLGRVLNTHQQWLCRRLADLVVTRPVEFGEIVNDRLPGEVYLCLPDEEKCCLLRSFNADARRPKPKTPKK